MGKNGKKNNGKKPGNGDGKSNAQSKASGGKKIETRLVSVSQADISPRPQTAPASSPKPPWKGKHRSMSEPVNPQSSVPFNSQISRPVPIQPSLLKRFYEALVLLAILGSNRGEYQEEEELEPLDEPSTLDNEKLRRSFVKSLAYLCDYDKGGPQTTAIALQQTPQMIVYWFASNSPPHGEDRVKNFLRAVLCSLASLERLDMVKVEADLFARAAKFASRRILAYVKILKPVLVFLLDYLERLNVAEDVRLVSWLRDLDVSLKSNEATCKFCYASRNSPEYQELQWRARDGAPCFKRFDTLRHLVGRLNHTMKAVSIIITAGIKLPHLFDNVKVMRAPSSPSSQPPLEERKPSLDAIVGRMTRDRQEMDSLRSSLQHMDQKHGLSKILKEQCGNQNWRPKVHAELILLDLFWTRNFEFVGGDRFIGCSKPACYCCFQYIQAHPGRWVVPACHNNHWLNWKPPEIFDENQVERIKTRERILNDIAQKIRNEAIQQIKERRAPAQWQPDSNTEISSARFQHLEHIAEISAGYLDQMCSDQKQLDDDSAIESDQGDAYNSGEECIQRSVYEEEDRAQSESEEDEDRTEREKLFVNCLQDEDDSDDDDEEGGAPLLAVRTI